ncbi:MAG TPA: ABC transporter permease [Candidatus Dormibacteraeota bacterium]|nr:ABC transporter permease [Candidatus Dormibacteraeota bacterium]
MNPSRLRPADLPMLAFFGLSSRRLRGLLAALGIAIGIGSMVGVLGITQSSEADLQGRLQQLGTNLLTIQRGSGVRGAEQPLPTTAAASAGMVTGVEAVSSTAVLQRVNVFRSDLVPTYQTGGLEVRAADPQLLPALRGQLLTGTFLSAASSQFPVTVLGYDAARVLGIDDVSSQPEVWLGGREFAVIGVLAPFPLAPEIDHDALVGLPEAASTLGYDGHPTRVYVRAQVDQVTAVAAVLPRTVFPQQPDQVAISRPSDALAAQLQVRASGTDLFLGLGAVALLVAGVGIANIMFVSVHERRQEIGLRRALGATRAHVATQFLAESVVLATLGGGVGVALGTLATVVWATYQSWQVMVPEISVGAGLVGAALIGGLAGLYPALRAAATTPTEALRTI